jgi:hypothetical protein
MNTKPDAFDQLMATFEQMLRICYEALSPTATPRQRAEAREMINLYLKTKPRNPSDP